MFKTRTIKALKAYRYNVDQNHSTVLGYSATSKHGAMLWSRLDWSALVRVDSGVHILNPRGGQYLHVHCKETEYTFSDEIYRVRCLHEIGTKWRIGTVKDVKVEYVSYVGWQWIVEVEKDS